MTSGQKMNLLTTVAEHEGFDYTCNFGLCLDDVMVLHEQQYDLFAKASKQFDSNTVPYILEFQLLLA